MSAAYGQLWEIIFIHAANLDTDYVKQNRRTLRSQLY